LLYLHDLMKKHLIILFLASTFYANAQTFLGQWRDHLSYRSCIDVTQSDNEAIFASNNGLFFVDKQDKSIQRLTKVHGLTSVGISRIEYSQENEVLLVGYADGGINLIKENSIINIPDILNSSLIGDKGIYDIHFQEQFAWLATGFGILVLDLERLEVRDTYIIGPNASQLRMTGVGIANGFVYVSSELGVQSASLNGPNLADFTNWIFETSLPAASNGYGHLEIFQDQVWVASDENAGTLEVVYYLDDGVWIPFLDGEVISDLNATQTHLGITRNGGVKVFNTDLAEEAQIFALLSGNLLSANASTIDSDGKMWIADNNNAAIYAANSLTNQEIVPSGPFTNSVFAIQSLGGDTWVAPGSYNGTWVNAFNNDSFFFFKDGVWRSFKDDPILVNSRDHVSVAINPFNTDQVFFGSWNQGLVEILDGEIQGVFNELSGAEAIQESEINPGVYRVGGLDFDSDGNLWMSNSHGEGGIVVRTPGENYIDLNYHPTLPNASVQEPIGELINTSNGQVWAIMGRSNGLFLLNYNGSIANQNDDEFKRLNTSTSNGGLHTNDVRCLVEDLDGEIWIGTSEGVTVFFNPTTLFQPNPSNAQRILIRQDGNLQWLLESEVVTTIAIDGGNRKWIGTESGGVFLMSEDGTEQILHFTVDNSPLFSNNIKDITIDDLTGEVFIGTNNGLVSFTADAVIPFEENECIRAFPNPVRPEHTGVVAIDGLKRDAIVKITDIAGNLVKETNSNGGRAVWDRTNFSGENVKTGVYLAMVVDEDGESSCITKILVIN